MSSSGAIHTTASQSKSIFGAIGHDELYLPYVIIGRKPPRLYEYIE